MSVQMEGVRGRTRRRSTDGHEVDRERYPYRMKDVCEKTGLPRQVVHFYISQGLVPEGKKTGRNMAYYSDAHVDRVLLVRRLQHERFLPLKAIRSLLDARDEDFSEPQRRLLDEVKTRLGEGLNPRERKTELVDVRERMKLASLTVEDLHELSEQGFLVVDQRDDGRVLVPETDVWMIDLWGEVRAAGFTPELGFRPADLVIYEQAMSKLFRDETQLIMSRLSHLPPDVVAKMVDRALPVIGQFLAGYHLAKARAFFAAM